MVIFLKIRKDYFLKKIIDSRIFSCYNEIVFVGKNDRAQ